MGDKSSIQWTDATWNPLRGCSRVSEGCRNCYAERVAARFSGPGLPYEGLVTIGEKGPRWNGTVRMVDKHLLDPIRWRRPRRIFVNSMSDLFHEAVSDDDRDLIFAVMLACEVLSPYEDGAPGLGHTFQILTKRPEVMSRYLSADPVEIVKRWAKAGDYTIHVGDGDTLFSEYVEGAVSHRTDDRGRVLESKPWGFVENVFPLRSAHIGVSVEDQASADARLPWLIDPDLPVAVRICSYEPALGPVDFTSIDVLGQTRKPVHPHDPIVRINALTGHVRGPDEMLGVHLDWIIVGGESGPSARPFAVEWARTTVKHCADAGVACFVKQLGAKPYEEGCAEACVFVGRNPSSLQKLRDRAGGDMDEWPADLRVRSFPEVSRVG